MTNSSEIQKLLSYLNSQRKENSYLREELEKSIAQDDKFKEREKNKSDEV